MCVSRVPEAGEARWERETFPKASAVIRLDVLAGSAGLEPRNDFWPFLGAGVVPLDRPPRRGVASDSEIRPTSSRDKLYLDPVSCPLALRSSGATFGPPTHQPTYAASTAPMPTTP